MDKVSDANATTPVDEKDAANKAALAQQLSQLVANKDSKGLEELLKTYSKEVLIEGLKGLDLGPTAVHATDHNRFQVLELLLDAGADKEAPDFNHSTLLSIAAYHGCTDIVTILLNKGADKEAKNKLNMLFRKNSC